MPPEIQSQQRRMTVDDTATPFGCCNFFDHCTDELMSLHYKGRLDLLDWMGFEVSDVCYKVMEFINFVRPEQTIQFECTPGYIADPCDDPYGFEFGSCKLTVEDFGRIGRTGPVRDVMYPKRYCETDPRRRLDGTLISDEREWDMVFALDTILQDVRRMLITGNSTTAGQFDGLENWVKTGYACAMLDSILINWNGNPMSGGAGVTWNGAAVAATFDFVDVLLAAYRRIRTRIGWSPVLGAQRPVPGNFIMLLPTFLKECLLDFYTCWTVCPGEAFNEANLNTFEARRFRDSLMGGLFGDGQIVLDGTIIPLLTYDWELIKGPKTGDIYFLTGAVGNYDIWAGEHLSAIQAAAEYSEAPFFTTDGGRLLGRVDSENECAQIKLWMHPRLFCKAPWAQIRFQAVQCEAAGGPMSPDPCDSSFYPETSFTPAECP